MGYQAAKLLHRLLAREEMPLQRILVPPVRVIARRSTDYRSLTDPAVIQRCTLFVTMPVRALKSSRCWTRLGFHVQTRKNVLRKKLARRYMR